MSTYITLLNWTDQGIRDYRETTGRADAFAAALDKLGAKLVSLHWTVGQYDAAATVEAPDDETVTAALLQMGALGNVRSTTLRAFDEDQMARIVAKAAG
jgi:uncharacterized protein with GYD domain